MFFVVFSFDSRWLIGPAVVNAYYRSNQIGKIIVYTRINKINAFDENSIQKNKSFNV